MSLQARKKHLGHPDCEPGGLLGSMLTLALPPSQLRLFLTSSWTAELLLQRQWTTGQAVTIYFGSEPASGKHWSKIDSTLLASVNSVGIHSRAGFNSKFLNKSVENLSKLFLYLMALPSFQEVSASSFLPC